MKVNRLVPACLLACFLLAMCNVPGRAAEPSAEPILRIDAGVHTAPIYAIATDKANRHLVTASEDKTVRVWNLATGQLLQTLRPPLDAASGGTLSSVAMSPDGKTVACGGYTGGEWDRPFSLYLFDRASGRLLRRIGGLPNMALRLAYSHDGRFLAATLQGANGLRVYSSADGSLAAQDNTYGGPSYGLDRDSKGRLVTTCYDGFIRLYDREFKLVAKQQAPGGDNPFSVSFSPDGAQVAVGYNEAMRLDVLSGNDLAFRFTPDLTGVEHPDFSHVAWSADGKFLFGGGRWSKDDGFPIRRWAGGGKGAYSDLPSTDSTIKQILTLQNGGIAFCSGQLWGVFDERGRRTFLQRTAIADYRGNKEGLRVAPDGTAVQFSYAVFGQAPASFSLATRTVQSGASSTTSLMPPRSEARDLKITDYVGSAAPKLNGTAMKLRSQEVSYSAAVTPNGDSFLLGTGGSLYLVEQSGRGKWTVPLSSAAWGVNMAGQVAVAALGDGTIRWFRLRDGQELLAFFPHADRKRWVAWTPEGYYDCSAGGEDLIGWHVNRGKDQAADFFAASRFRSIYYRPAVIARVLKTLDGQEALRLANEEVGRKQIPLVVAKILPPVVSITAPPSEGAVSASRVTIRYTLRTPSGEPVTSVKALIDGRPVETVRNLSLVATDREASQELALTIPERDCEVSLVAENRHAASEPSTVRLQWRGQTPETPTVASPTPKNPAPRSPTPKGAVLAVATPEFVIKPRLYVLAVGVNQYDDATITDLNYSTKDANDFAAALMLQKEGLYREVVVRVLTDKEATRDAILDGLEWVQRQTTSKDVAMVFLSGHGINDPNGFYYYLPVGFNSEKIKSTGLPFSEIKNTVAAIAGKALFFVDSCHSGNVMGKGKSRGVEDVTAVVNELASAENGVVVFAASTGNQVSLEDAAWGNGAFTKAVIEGLQGGADYTKSGKITVNMLDLYISEKVKELTQGRQTPTTTKPPTVPDFPIAVRH